MFKPVLILFVIGFVVVAESINVVSRKEWGARPPKSTPVMLQTLPPNYVVIHHADSPSCYTKMKCEARVRGFQNFHIDTRQWDDIGYNFLVGEDGNIYEGRGWGIKGAHTRPYNNKSIGICMIGTFTKRLPNAKAMDAVKDLISYALVTNNISADFKLIGHRQASATECPGTKLYEEIQKWPHWIHDEKNLVS